MKKTETDKKRNGQRAVRKWSWTPLANENRLISEELSSKHREASTKQLVSSLSSSAKPITASDVGLFKANQSQEVFSPLPFSPPAYRRWLGNESLLKVRRRGAHATSRCRSLRRPAIRTILHYSSLSFSLSSSSSVAHYSWSLPDGFFPSAGYIWTTTFIHDSKWAPNFKRKMVCVFWFYLPLLYELIWRVKYSD